MKLGELHPPPCYKKKMRRQDYEPRPADLKWLLDSDPAIRWQVMRDLTDEAPRVIAVERSRVAKEGWGFRLLARQSPAGYWGSKQDRGWLITLYTLVVLKDLGLDPASAEARKMIERVDKGLVFKPLNNRPFLDGETEPCINGRILAIGAYFKKPNEELARQLLSEQLEDGGWNCDAQLESPKRPNSRRSSFHTTICVLEGCWILNELLSQPPLPRRAREAKSICSSVACSGRFELERSSTIAGCVSRSRRSGITTFCVDSII
jgi:hypothetical protein